MIKKNVSQVVFDTIEGKIISGEWKSGTKITSEPQLAKELQVSRMSVREAIEKLVALGILTKKRGEGTFVNELKPSVYLNSLIPMITLDRDDFLEILEFRLIVEVESIRLFVKKANNQDIIELRKYYDEMVKYKDDPVKFAESDTSFHMKIAEGTKNSLIKKVNSVLKKLLDYHQQGLYENLGPKGGLIEHKKILESIEKRDEELSVLFMKRHIERTINDLYKIREQKKEG
ncbi:FadR family transcriptional regulator [Clostridium sp. D2Q-11]|uniref:FadR family transcriptional regulator n=1 Tax=Anaeromonas frigoriresistens TaxID=2683708 RepID=A0A942UXL2_9FIRM|nr:FadR/GntR family transcriptional regulator [Anaeromonas frigoriresistens]MBS4538669.1 FadR family transcriptional regulator [Anaeromonas frigoriresistens]